jgi:hypothetical protein
MQSLRQLDLLNLHDLCVKKTPRISEMLMDQNWRWVIALRMRNQVGSASEEKSAKQKQKSGTCHIASPVSETAHM